jgi:hypothetical protein
MGKYSARLAIQNSIVLHAQSRAVHFKEVCLNQIFNAKAALAVRRIQRQIGIEQAELKPTMAQVHPIDCCRGDEGLTGEAHRFEPLEPGPEADEWQSPYC